MTFQNVWEWICIMLVAAPLHKPALLLNGRPIAIGGIFSLVRAKFRHLDVRCYIQVNFAGGIPRFAIAITKLKVYARRLMINNY
jgi:hypothetical protein